MTDKFPDFLTQTIDAYVGAARAAFQRRIDDWSIDIFEKETNEAVGGLLARQLSLATNIARNPFIWNAHVLPILLRCMADVYITFCWILADPGKRSRQFIEYGLGQEKLAIEKYRESLSLESDPDADAIRFLEVREKLLDAELASFLIPVNLGAWSEMSIRDMAIEVREKQFYDIVFAQFSASVHSTWQHIWRLNLHQCTNPLHMGHRIPFDPILPMDPNMFATSAKYLCKTFAKFDSDVLQGNGAQDAYQVYELVNDRFSEYVQRQETSCPES